MSQRTNRATKAIQEIDKYIKSCEKAGLQDAPYRAGAVWGLQKAQEIIRKRNI